MALEGMRDWHQHCTKDIEINPTRIAKYHTFSTYASRGCNRLPARRRITFCTWAWTLINKCKKDTEALYIPAFGTTEIDHVDGHSILKPDGLSILGTSWLNSLSDFKSTEIHFQLPRGSAQDRALINSSAASHRKRWGHTRDPLRSLELNPISHINEDCD